MKAPVSSVDEEHSSILGTLTDHWMHHQVLLFSLTFITVELV